MVGIHQRTVKCTTVCLPAEFIKMSNADGKTANVPAKEAGRLRIAFGSADALSSEHD
jgi:hypothetical protein